MMEAIKTGAYHHKSLDIKMELKAPVILIPQNVFQPQQRCVVIDVGVIKLGSKLKKYESFVDYKMIQSAEQVYDIYEASL
jgi:hypothetical protein